MFLMFMAGLESPVSKLRKGGKKVAILAGLNGVIPFLMGVAIATVFGYNVTESLLLGIIFISSSVAIIIPTLQNNKLMNKEIGTSVLAATVFEDIASLFFLSILCFLFDMLS